MSCYISPITGQTSVLAQLLDTNYGPMVRDRIMSYVYSDQFLRDHGDFRSPVTKIPLDSIGKEPAFEWVESSIINTPKDLQVKVESINKELSKLPVEVKNSIKVVEDVPQDIIGRPDVSFAMKDVLESKGITDPLLINWAGIARPFRHPNEIESTKQLQDKVENSLKKKFNKSQYPELKSNPLASQSFDEWVEALKDFPPAFQDIMISHAIKHIVNPNRKSKFVLQLSKVALVNTYGIMMNKPNEMNRLGKLYDQEVVKLSSDATEHEKSASGKGYWVHIPRTKSTKISDWKIIKGPGGKGYEWAIEYKLSDEVDIEFFNTEQEARDFLNKKNTQDNPDNLKASVDLLRKLSPSTWCTSSGMADHYVQNFDNYLLIVDGVTVAGIEAYPASVIEDKETLLKKLKRIEISIENGMGGPDEYSRKNEIERLLSGVIIKREVKEVTSRANNGVAPIEHLDDILAFFDKHGLDQNNTSVNRAIEFKNSGKTDQDVMKSFNDDFDFFGDDFFNEPDFYMEREDPYDGWEADLQRELERNQALDLERIDAEKAVQELNSVQEVLEFKPFFQGLFRELKPELRNNQEVATSAVTSNAYNISFIDETLPFYKDLAFLAVQDTPDVYKYLPEELRDNEKFKSVFNQYLIDFERDYGYNPNELPFSKTSDSLIQGYYDPKTDDVVVVAKNTPVKESSKVGIHEVAHRGMIRMAKELGGFTELNNALLSAEEELMKKLPKLLERTGHKSVDSLLLDYGFDSNTKEGKAKLLMELAARWAEDFTDMPHESWWKELLQKIGLWIKNFTGKTLTEQEVNDLIGGFVKYGSKTTNNLEELSPEPEEELSEDEIEEKYQELEDKLDLDDTIAPYLRSDYFDDSVSLLENTKYWIKELDQFESLKQQITEALQAGENDRALTLKKSLDSIVNSGDFEFITNWYEPDRTEFRKSADYIQEKVDTVKADLIELRDRLKEERSNLIKSLTAKPAEAEPGVYEEFGTYYRFNTSPSGIITGEYRQGKTGEWKPLNNKTAQDKHERFVGPPQSSTIQSFKTEDDAIAAVEGYNPDSNSFSGPGIKTGTIISIAGKLFRVVNDPNQDIDFQPVNSLPQAPVQLTITQTAQPFTYSRTSDNSYEVSTAGDKRFSALNATLKDGRTIEEAYQLDVKGYRAEGNDWKLGKGKKPLRNITPEQSYEEYKSLWKQWAQENPELLEDLRQKAQGKVLTDTFASSPVSQARALAEILNETAPQQQTPLPPPSVQTTEQIYSQLGNKTQSENIQIVSWNTIKLSPPIITKEINENSVLLNKVGDIVSFPLFSGGGKITDILKNNNNYTITIEGKFGLHGENEIVKVNFIGNKFINLTVNGKLKELKDTSKIFYLKDSLLFLNDSSKIVSTRQNGGFSKYSFGNLYTSDTSIASNNASMTLTKSTKEAVERYIDWVINSSDYRAKNIRGLLETGLLKGKPILYYTELNEPSHATALDYLINRYNWNQPTAQQTPLPPVSSTPTSTPQPSGNITVEPLMLPPNTIITKRQDVTASHVEEMKAKLKLSFVMKALSIPTTQFKVTWQNPAANKTSDNYGFTEADYARMLDEIRMEMGDQFPSNIVFFPAFEFAMNNNPQRLMKVFSDRIQEFTAGRTPFRINPESMAEMTAKMEIAITDKNGVTVDYFTKRHGTGSQEAVGSLMLTYFLDLYNKANGRVSAPHLISQVLLACKGFSSKPGPTQAMFEDIVNCFTFKGDDNKNGVYDNRKAFLDLLFENLSYLGYRIDYNSKQALKDYFFKMKSDPSFMQSNFEKQINLEDSKDWQRDYDNYLEDTLDYIEVDDALAKTLRDWQDSSFELSSKDQATGRLKLFIANQKMMESFSVGTVQYDPANTEAIDLSTMARTPDGLTLAQARQINGKSVMLQGYTPEALEKAIMAKFPRLPKKGMFGFPVITSFDTLYENAQGVLSSIPGLEKNMNTALNLLRAEEDPNLSELADRLEQSAKVDKRNFREFIRVMNMQYNEFFVVNSKRRAEGKIEYLESRVFGAQRYAQNQVIIDKWKQAQNISPIIKIRPNGERVIDVERARVHAEVIKFLSKLERVNELSDEEAVTYSLKMNLDLMNMSPEAQEFMKGVNILQLINEERITSRIPRDKQRLFQKSLLKKMFAEHNILLDDKVLDDMAAHYNGKGGVRADGIAGTLKNTRMKTSWVGQYSETESSGKPNGIFSAFFYAAAGMTKGEDADIPVTEELENSVLENNPLYSETTTMKVLAKYFNRYADKLFNGVHTSLEGKQIWDYSLPSALSRAVIDLKTDHNGYTTKLAASVWGENYYLKGGRLKDLKLGYLEGLKVDRASKGTVRTRMSDREQLLTSILLYQNQGRDYANMLSLTHSDKTTTPVFANIPKVKVTTKDGSISEDIISAFYSVFSGEFNRIHRVNNLIQTKGTSGSKSMDMGGKQFLLFSFLNFENLSQEEKLIMYDEDGNLKPLLTEDVVQFVRNKTYEYMTNLVSNAKDYWASNGIDLKLIDRSYSRKLLNTLEGTTSEKYKLLLDSAIADYVLNSTLWNMSSAVMLMGDPANAEWKGSVEKTMAEYAKRLAKDIAPRQQLMFDRQNYSQLIVNDVEMKYEYAANIKSNVLKSKATDAQEFTTVREHLDVMKAAGKLSDEMYNKLIAKVNKFDTKDEEEFTEEELATMLEDGSSPLQPNKPVYAGTRFDNNLVFYDYIKSSSFPLLPQFTHNSELDKVRKLMEGKTPGVDRYSRLVFESGSKMGNSGTDLKLFNAANEFQEPTEEALAANTKLMDRAHFGIQQEVPFDLNKEQVNVITQMDKLIVEGILDMTGFNIGNQLNLSGRQVRKMKEDVRIKSAKMKLKNLYASLGVADNTKNIPAKQVIKLLIETARQSEFSPNDIALLESTLLEDAGNGMMREVSTYPLFFHSAVEKFEKLIMAKVKSITEFPMPGKSYVQVSSIGMIRQDNLSDKAKLGVITVGDFDMSKPLRHMSIDPVTGEVIPAQVIMPFNFSINGKKVNIEDYVVDGKLDLERVPRELLQLVAARIPNQGHNSMMAVEIVGFTPNWLGDAMIVPSAITGQMGSDFDVDKLFTYQRPYMYNEVSGKFEVYKEGTVKEGESPEVYEEIKAQAIQRLEDLNRTKDENGNFKWYDIRRSMEIVIEQRYGKGNPVPTHLATKEEQTFEELQQDYFNIHWGVLTHPGMYSKVLQALDKGDLGFDKGAANDVFKRKSEGPNIFFSPITQLKQFQSGKDAKDLVGMTSLSSTFDANLQNKELRLGTYLSVPGGSVVEQEDSIRLDGIDLTTISGESLAEGFESKYNEDGTPDYSTWYSKHDNITIDQTGAVDNAKDRRLDNLNITMATYPAFDAMNKLHGKTKDGNRSVSKLFQCALSAQEILWEYTAEYRKSNDSLSDDEYSSDLRTTVIEKLKRKYIKKFEEAVNRGKKEGEGNVKYKPSMLDSIEVNYATLKNAFNASQSDKPLSPEYFLTQLKVLSTFDALSGVGERLRELQKTLNQDTNGAGPNLVYALQQLENYSNLFEQNGSKIFLNEDSLATGQAKELFEMTVPIAVDLLRSVFPVDAIENVTRQIAAYTGKPIGQLSLNVQKDIVRHMRYYAISTSPAIAMDTTAERFRLLYGSDTVESLAKRVERLKAQYPDNIFLRTIDTSINTMGQGPDFVSTIIQSSGRMSDNVMIQEFAALIQSNDPNIREIAEDLVNYAMILTPQSNTTSIIRKVPTGIILGTDVSTQLRRVDTELRTHNGMPDGFMDQLHQHVPSLALPLSSDLLSTNLGHYNIEGRDYPEILCLSLSSKQKEKLETHLAGKDKKCAPYVRLFSKQEGKIILYKLVSDGDFVTYQRISTLGKKNAVEYNSSVTGIVNSIFLENRAGYDFKTEGPFRALEVATEKLISETSDPENALSRWSLESGGQDVLTRGLEQLSADTSVPTYLRTLAEVLAETADTASDFEARLALNYQVQPLTVQVNTSKSGARGSYKAFSNTLTIRVNSDIKGAATTLLHETIHQRSSAILHALGWISKERLRKANSSMSEEAFQKMWESYTANSEAFAKKNPELYQKVKELDKLRLQAFEELRSRLIAESIDVDAKMVTILNDKLDGSETDALLYSLSSMSEFVAHVMTDKKTMEFLNTVESRDGQSWVSKMIDSFFNFLQEVMNTLGISYNDKSILKECLALSYDISGLNISEKLDTMGDTVLPQSIFVDTESKANHLQHTLENVFNHPVTRTDNHLGHQLDIEEKLVSPIAGGTQFFNDNIHKLARQLQQLDNSIARPVVTDEDRKRRVQAELLYNEAKEDYDKMLTSKDEMELMDTAKRQLEWVNSVVSKPNIHLQEVTIAWSILDTWGSLTDIYTTTYVPGDVLEETLRSVEGLATVLSKQMLKQSMYSVITEGERQTGIKLTFNDLGINLKDVNWLEKETIAYERDMNRASQMLSTFAQYQVQNAQSQLRQLTNKLKEFKSLVSPSEYSKFIQSNANGSVFGLVQELDSTWYQGAAKARYTLRTWLEGMFGLDLNDPAQRARRIDGSKAAYNNFWKNMSATGEVVDIRLLLDLETGELRTDPEAQAEIARLKSISKDHLVDDVIAKSQKDYKKYLELREVKFEEIDNNVIMAEFNMTNDEALAYSTMTPDQQTAFKLAKILELTNARQEQRKKEWEFFNSPVNFFNTMPRPDVTVDDNIYLQNGRFKPWFVPKDIPENFDSKYAEIAKNPNLAKGYEILKSLSEQFRSYLPPTIAENLHENFLPIISPEMMAEASNGISKIRKTGVGRSILNSISSGRAETVRRDEDGIPISYVGEAPRKVDASGKKTKEIDMSKISTDLPRMFEMFGDMAIHYNAMYPVGEMLDVARRLVMEENKNRAVRGEKGLPNLINLMKFYEDAVVFRKSKSLEGVDTTPVYSLNPMTHYARKREMSELLKELGKVNEEIILKRVDEVSDPKNPLLERRNVLEDRIKKIQGEARYLTASKAGDTLINLQQLKSMSYNPFSAVSNLTFGYMATYIHARGFRAGKDGFTTGDFTKQQLDKAYSMMKGNIANSWLKAFGYSHSDLSRKISAIISRANAIEAMIDTRFGQSNLSEQKSNLQQFLDPTAAQKSGDWLTKGAVIIARALNTPVQVTVNGEVKTINLFDALNVEGEWDAQKYGENKEWSSENASEQIAWNKFLFRTRKVMLLIFGNQDKNIPLSARNSVWGRLLGQFRLSWIPEGIKTRWGSNQGYDEVLEREIEGRYRTMLRMPGFGLPLILKQMASVVTGADAFEGSNLKDFEIENMRRNMAGLAYTALFAAMYYTLKGFVPDEEELRKLRRKGASPGTAAKIASNVAYRSFQDLILYASPDMFEQITGNLVPSWSVISDTKKAIAAWYKIAFDEKYEWEELLLKQTKALPFANLLNKWEFYSKRDISAAVR